MESDRIPLADPSNDSCPSPVHRRSSVRPFVLPIVMALAFFAVVGTAIPRARVPTLEKGYAIGASCSTDSSCSSSHCSSIFSGKCVECSNDNHCSARYFCDATANQCARVREVGSECQRGSQCVSDRCVSSRCVQCSVNDDCIGGKYCGADNRCVDQLPANSNCRSNSDCASGRCSFAVSRFGSFCG
eukprot:c4488_g1_i1.p1 GENE.c4488_g1_i1~~c4488_g1_i1.p1  ORF type:complete len:187 (+),score=23.28 c4488_g1_i1:43-603(+)